MQAIYMSDSYVVVQMQTATAANEPESTGAEQTPSATGSHPVLPRLGFEIVDRRHGREVYLDGPWAEVFARQIQAWQQSSPSQEEVENTLEGYAALAQTPIALH